MSESNRNEQTADRLRKKMTREEAVKILTRERDNDVFVSEYRNIVHEALDLAIEALKQTEIVRCKDCRHSRIEGDTTKFLWCGYWNKPTDGIRYCSDGERSK